MRNVVLKYGAISGLIVSAQMLLAMALIDWESTDFDMPEYLGYAGMLVALSLVFLGVKSYRDKELQGHIRFGKAFAVGCLIALVSSVFYVTTWEIYYRSNDTLRETFGKRYMEKSLTGLKEEGMSEEEITKKRVEMEEMWKMYEQMPFRVGLTFAEILPIGILVALLSAAILRKRQVLPDGA